MMRLLSMLSRIFTLPFNNAIHTSGAIDFYLLVGFNLWGILENIRSTAFGKFRNLVIREKAQCYLSLSYRCAALNFLFDNLPRILPNRYRLADVLITLRLQIMALS